MFLRLSVLSVARFRCPSRVSCSNGSCPTINTIFLKLVVFIIPNGRTLLVRVYVDVSQNFTLQLLQFIQCHSVLSFLEIHPYAKFDISSIGFTLRLSRSRSVSLIF